MSSNVKGPSLSDYFRSFYYENQNTYVPAVDLSEATLKANGDLLEPDQLRALNEDVFKALTHSEFTEIFSQPMSDDPQEHENRVTILKKNGFELQEHGGGIQYDKTKKCYCTVVHPDFDKNPLLYAGDPLLPTFYTSDRGDYNSLQDEDRLLGLALRKRIKELGKEMQVRVPDDKLVLINTTKTDPKSRYCIIADQMAGLSMEKTITKIKEMSETDQRQLGKDLCQLIQKVGIAQADFHFIRLTRKNELYFLSNPTGLLVSKQSPHARGESVEKSARIGLSFLMSDAKEYFGYAINEGGAFLSEVEHHYDALMKPQLSKWKITVSILSLGLIPLIFAIVSLVQVKAIQNRCDALVELTTKPKSKENQQAILATGQSIFRMTEEVPFNDAFEIIKKAASGIDF